MKYLLLIVLPLVMAQAQEEAPSPTPAPSVTPPEGRGLSDFARRVPLASPSATLDPATPFHLRESWSRLVGKSFSDVMMEADRAYMSGNFALAADISSYGLLMPISKPQASIATVNRGKALAAEEDLEGAMRDFNESVTLDPRNVAGYLGRALLLRRQGDNAGAQKDYAEAIRIDPKRWQTYFNRARSEIEDGDKEAAMKDLDRALQIKPDNAFILTARAGLFLRNRDWDKVIADSTEAIKLSPNDSEPYFYRARALAAKGEVEKAEADLATVARVAPSPRHVLLNGVAWLRATSPEQKLRRGEEAVKLATEACTLSEWKTWQLIDTLAAAYAEAGDFEKAKQYEQQALAMKLSPAEQAQLQARLALYQQRKPFRDDPPP